MPIPIPDTLTGLVIDRFSPLYDEARLDYNTGLPPASPKYIVYCHGAHDVQNDILWSRGHGVPLRARSGRHSYENYSVLDGGVVIDVSKMNQIVLYRSTGLATIGAGAQLLPIYQTLWNDAKVTIPGGSCPTVGIAGLTLGGGFGLISRLHGLTCDALQSLTMVNANGELVQASATENEDLFWASCGGGGGNFGIVTSFTFKTVPVDKVTVFVIHWNWSDLKAVFKAFQVWANPEGLDRRVVPLVNLTSETAGQVAVVGEFVGPLNEMLALLQPLLQTAPPPISLSLKYEDYIDAVYFFAGVAPPSSVVVPLTGLQLPHPFSNEDHEKFKNTSAYQFDLFPDEAIDTMIYWLSHTAGAANLVAFDVYGGAISDRSNHETAFPHRRGVRASLQYQAYWDHDEEAPANIRWVEGFRRAMLPWAHDGYVNYIDRDVLNWPDAYYAENLRRLLRVKREYDPGDVFNFPQGLGQLLREMEAREAGEAAKAVEAGEAVALPSSPVEPADPGIEGTPPQPPAPGDQPLSWMPKRQL
ncbi:MAG: FAD-binding oxidoreductase [Bacillota bacterium]